ncbi:MAG: PTS sugar transporter subunit IIC [Defluviitaleaceae bacterium]|nr:PTS sugar transporter subunit IIC [Defluviitaleaceae bacterium]
MSKIRKFLHKKDIVFSLKRYGIEALSSMALGLFSSLVVGLIMREFGTHMGLEFLVIAGSAAMSLTGGAIGAAVAFGLKAPNLVLFSSIITGFMGNELGGPAGAFVAAALGAEFGKLISRETKVDIIVTPVTTIITGAIAAAWVGPGINAFMTGIGSVIMWATELMPLPMGILVSAIMGLVLTAPISSAALAIMLDLSGIAAGAAVAGGSAHMIGFAVASFRENGVGGLISQGLGTSMLQIPNIIKNPKILIPAVAASIVSGPLSTVVFRMENIPTGAGMGTSGLVGQFGTLTAMGYNTHTFIAIIVVHFITPAVVAFVASEIMRKRGAIKSGDMKLEV